MKYKNIIFLLLVFYANLCAGVRIKGTIQDLATRHTLANANIVLCQSRIGTSSDKHGNFELHIPGNKPDTLMVSFMGYEHKRIPISPHISDSLVLYIDLVQTVLTLNELKVEADRYADEIRSLKMDPGATRVRLKELRAVPFTLFPDINRSLQFLPGVISTNELTNELNVRGGNPDQNLTLLDGVPVYYPFHVFGIASAFNPDMVGEVQFSPGGFSARYGNRLSSAMNVRSHSPHKKLEMSTDISLLTASMTISSRLNNNLECVGSFRKSFYDLLFKGTENAVPYAFYDGFGKLVWTPDSSNTVNVMYFSFKDRFRDENTDQKSLYASYENPLEYLLYDGISQRDYSWRNKLYSLSWDHRWKKGLTTTLQAYSSLVANNFQTHSYLEFPDNIPPKYDQAKEEAIEQNKSDPIDVTNTLTDRTIKMDLNWKPATFLDVNGGLQYSHFSTNYGWGKSGFPNTAIIDYKDYIRLYFDDAPDTYFNFDKGFHSKAGFAELFFKNVNNFNLRLGLRATDWSYQQDISLDPRVNVSYNLSDNWTVKTAYGHVTQGMATALEDGPIGFLRLYFPVGDSLKPESVDHFVAGVEYESTHGSRMTLNGYIKEYDNIIKSVGPQPNFIQTPGRALGLEFFVQSEIFGWDSWLAVTLARTYRLVESSKLDTNWDQRYRFDLFASKHIGKNWRFSWSWVLYSGIPYSKETYDSAIRDANWTIGLDSPQDDSFDGISMNVPPGRIRYPWYHRLDISLAREFHFSTWHMEFYFSMRNVYARKNVLYYKPGGLSCDTHQGHFINYYIKHPFRWLPPIPTLGLRVVL